VAQHFAVGSVVVNFNTTAVVVGHFAAACGEPVAETGWPILRAIGASGKPRGGKWLADPAKCTPVSEGGR
jgi:hypothetical protein